MTAVIDAPPRSPIGSTGEETAARRRQRSAAYQVEEARLATYRSIAATVIHGRGARGWTQRRLAEEIGTTHTVVSRIESGRHAVSVDTLLRLSDALGVTFNIGTGVDESTPRMSIKSG
jgi:Helix-turn-helix.